MPSLSVEQIYTSCLAQGSYYIVSNNEAIIIDPIREAKPYLDRLAKDGVKLKYILETHFHADFVSGHLDLSKLTGAPIIYGPEAHTEFDFIQGKDGEFFKFGNCSFKLIHTPGHTLESSVYLLFDENGKEYSLFTGDTLFIGDVGRPDLAQFNSNYSQEDLAGMLYDSLRNKIINLPSNIIIYPGHGAGSACGKSISKETISTLGIQLETNYALRKNMTREEFILEVLDGLINPPDYFRMNVAINKSEYTQLDDLLLSSNHPLDLSEFETLSNNPEILILDSRDPTLFFTQYIPGSLSIGLDGDFAPWAGSIISNVNQQIILICDEGKEEETIIRLSRVGFDKVIGYLKGGIHTWNIANKPTEHIFRITANQFAESTLFKNAQIFDVRKESEFQKGHLVGALNLPLANIHKWSDEINEINPFVIHCATGYRSMIASSILKAKGIYNFVEIEGGYKAISKTQITIKN
ncbi:MAG: MBL fold metallo-hydrolase [Saprospiraceae bacterium]